MRNAVLLVEDEPDLLQVLVTALERALPGYDILAASSADEAEARLAGLLSRGDTLALVVADHQLSGDRTGLDLIIAVRAAHPDVATMLLTGSASRDVADEARVVGATVLWKPVRLATLLAEVRAAMQA